jgi:pimeloyl-ACP methyl ester carboxylesterase
MKPVSSGYADVNGINLFHEIYGQGEPLALIHGGLATIGEMQGWVQPRAKTRQVIAVEMQGHGRTADTDRPMTFVTIVLADSTTAATGWAAARFGSRVPYRHCVRPS